MKHPSPHAALALAALLFTPFTASAQISDWDARLHAISPLTVLVGDQLTVTAGVTNSSGSNIDDLILPFAIFKNADPGNIREQIGTSPQIKVGAGENKKFTAVMTIPANATLGFNTLGYQLVAPYGDGSWVFFDTPITILGRDNIDLQQRSSNDQIITPKLDSYHPGSSIVASTVLNNIGGIKSHPFSVEWRLSYDEEIGDADDIILREVAYNDGIGPNGSENLTISAPLVLPGTLAPDDYALGCIVRTGIDAVPNNNDIFFADDILTVENPAPTGVDLRFAAPQFHAFAPTGISAGQPLAVQFRAANIGTVAAGNFTLSISASTTAFLGTGIELGSIDYSGAQPGADPETAAGLFTMQPVIYNTTGLTPGSDYYLRVELISAEDTDNSNNVYYHPTPFHVAHLLPDLQPLDDWEIVQPGAGVLRDNRNCLHIRGTVRNNGPGPSPGSRFAINCRRIGNFNNVLRNFDYEPVESPAPLPGSLAYELQFTTVNGVPPLAPGETYFVDREISLWRILSAPLGLEFPLQVGMNDGNYRVRITLDSSSPRQALGFSTGQFGNRITETDENNNQVTLPGSLHIIDSGGFPSLSARLQASVNARQQGQSFTVSGVALNDRRPGGGQFAINGSSPATTISFFLDDRPIGPDLNVPALGQGDEITISDHQLDIPIGFPSGSYVLRYVIDPDDLIAESSECDNEQFTGHFNVGPLPDLILSGNTPVEFNSGVQQGSPLTITGAAYNFGLALALPSTLNAYLSDDAVLDPSDILLNSARLPQMSQLTETPFSVSGRPGRFFPDGRYFVLLQFDADTEVNEINEDNNVYNIGRVQVGGSANLNNGKTRPFISHIENYAGGEIYVQFTTHNTGNIAALAHSTAFYVTDESGQVNIFIGEHVHTETIPGGGSVNVIASLQLPVALEPGEYFVTANLDSRNQVTESDEQDNGSISSNNINITNPVGNFQPEILAFNQDEATNQTEIYYTTRAGENYRIETSTDLTSGSWSPVGPDAPGVPTGLIEWRTTLLPVVPRRFMRVIQLP